MLFIILYAWYIKIETTNATTIFQLFQDCSHLLDLPDISNWKTGIDTNMSSMFKNCKSLTSLPDISKWKKSQLTVMNSLFDECCSLFYLPNISKWDTRNVNHMGVFFTIINLYLLFLTYLKGILEILII